MQVRSWAAYVVGFGLSIAGTIAVVAIVDDTVSYPTMIGVLAVLFLGVLIRELVVLRDPMTPAGIVAVTGLLLFVMRPLTILANGVTSPGAVADSQYFSPSLMLAGSAGLIEVLIFFGGFYVIYYGQIFLGSALHANEGVVFATFSGLDERKLRALPRKFNASAIQVAVITASFVAIGALLYLIESSGGLAAYFTGLANRSDFLSGRSFLVLVYVPVQIALVMNVLHRRSVGLPAWNWVNIVGLISLGVSGVAAGGRGPLVIGVVLPLVLLKQLSSKPFRRRTIALLGVVLLVVAVSYSIVVRNSTYDQGQSLARFREAPIPTMLEQITSGAETRPFDSLIRLNDSIAHDNSFRYLHGSTYAAAPSWFVPRALWSNKPNGGGNTWFTSTYVPRFYGVDKVETSLSAIGEGFANFGYAGDAVAGAVLGAFAFSLRRERYLSRGLLGRTLMICLTPMLFSLIRGDLYQGGSLTLATVLGACVVFFVCSRAGAPHDRPVKNATASALAMSTRRD